MPGERREHENQRKEGLYGWNAIAEKET